MTFDILDDELEEDIDDFINMQLDTIQITPIQVDDTLLNNAPMSSLEEQDIDNGILIGYYSVYSRKYARWLTTLQRPKDMSITEFHKFKKEALKFVVHNKMLFK